MKHIDILLSSGSCPWMGIKEITTFAKNAGYTGIELLPTRKIILEIDRFTTLHKSEELSRYNSYLKNVKALHQNWRLDIGLDKSYGIKFPMTVFLNVLRFMLFPKTEESNEKIRFLSKNLNVPLVVHHISNKWIQDNESKEFLGGILYEVIGTSISPNKLKNWMSKKLHNVVIDLRDDQSLIWAKKYGYNTWQEFWKWIGLKKIKNLQLTLIGTNGLRKIIKHQQSLPEEQLLWLFNKKWKGDITVEVNPLTIFILFTGDMKKGIKLISKFIKQTLIEGKKWSI